MTINQHKMKITETLREMHVGEVVEFPAKRYNVVREACYRMKVIREMRFKTSMRFEDGVIEVKRIA